MKTEKKPLRDSLVVKIICAILAASMAIGTVVAAVLGILGALGIIK